MAKRWLVTVVLTLAVAGVAPAPAAAWGFEPHKYIMERTIQLLPPQIRPFFLKYQTTIVEHVVDPDLWRTAGFEQEPPRHFLDMDAYGPYPFPNFPREQDEAIKRYGADFVAKNGQLPWRATEIYQKLVEAFRQQAPYSRDNIKFFSSVLTHYVSDGHVPFHAVVNYDGQLTGQHGIHSRFETELFERYRATLRVVPKPVMPIANPRDFIFETLMASFPLAQTVLDADKAAVEGRELYDDRLFHDVLREGAADSRAAAGRLDHRLGVDDHRGLGGSRPAGTAAGTAPHAAEGPPRPLVRLDQLLRRPGERRAIARSMGSRTHSAASVMRGRDECQVILASARSDPDGGVDPHRRRRRQSLDAAVGPHDRAGAEKADARDDLRRDATGIAVRPRHLDRHEREQRRADAR